ncbi:MAG: DUF5665 domain-containing protein [Bacillota bacterium]|nr:DUF5665 domain-containing protein [Bacillota bacterium]
MDDIKVRLVHKIEELSINIEKMKLAEYVDLLHNPKRLLYINFLAGVARGVGLAIGFTLLGAVVIYVLQRLVLLNLPLISDFIAEIIWMVQSQMNQGRGGL